MIDLNYKKKTEEPKEESLGMVMLGVLPFVAGFWWILTQGLIR